MDNFEVKEALESFRIIVDSREHATSQAQQRYEAFGVPYTRGTLKYGDYCGDVILPDGKHIHDESHPISPVCCIERKMSLDELALCFGRERGRFLREFDRAATAGAKVYLLIEGGSFEAILCHRYRSKLNPKAMFSSLTAWAARYNMTPLFCKADTSGAVIKEILYRDIKERLERGDYG